MSWNGSGVYSLPALYFPEAPGNLVDSTRYNGTLNDISTGLNNALAKDGQNSATANLPMAGFKHTGAAGGTATGEYLTYGQRLFAADGTVGAPSLTFASGSTDGFYKSAANTVATSIAGVLANYQDNKYLNVFTKFGVKVGVDWGWTSAAAVMDLSTRGAIFSDLSGLALRWNTYYDGTNSRAKFVGIGTAVNLNDFGFGYFAAPSVAAAAIQTYVTLFQVDQNGIGSMPLNPCVCATDGGTQSRTSATLTIMNGFTVEQVDAAASWNGSSTFTVPTGGGGVYEMRYTGVVTGAGGSVIAQMQFFKNGSNVGLPVEATSASGTDYASISNQLMLNLVAGDTIAAHAARAGGAVSCDFTRGTITIRKVQ